MEIANVLLDGTAVRLRALQTEAPQGVMLQRQQDDSIWWVEVTPEREGVTRVAADIAAAELGNWEPYTA